MKVFLSSTFDDLQCQREIVRSVLSFGGHKVDGMEDTGANDRDTTHDSKARIGECDALFGLYAHRYGTISEGTEKSIVELEYDYARELDIPTYCFLVGEDFASKPRHIDDGHKKQRLLDFKKRIAKENVVRYFNDDEALRREVEWQLAVMPPPRSRSSIPSIPAWYVNRAELIQRLEDAKANPIVLVYGEKGIGKTTLLAGYTRDNLGVGKTIWLTCNSRRLLADQVSEAVAMPNLASQQGTVFWLRLGDRLDNMRSVLVLDDVHVLLNDPLFEALNTARFQAKRMTLILVCNEREVQDSLPGYGISVGPMKHEEAAKLMEQYIQSSFGFSLGNDWDKIVMGMSCHPAAVCQASEEIASLLFTLAFKQGVFGSGPSPLVLAWLVLKYTQDDAWLDALESVQELIDVHDYAQLLDTRISLLIKMGWVRQAIELNHQKRSSSTIPFEKTVKTIESILDRNKDAGFSPIKLEDILSGTHFRNLLGGTLPDNLEKRNA